MTMMLIDLKKWMAYQSYFRMYQGFYTDIKQLSDEQAGLFLKAVYEFKKTGDYNISTGDPDVDLLLDIQKHIMFKDAEDSLGAYIWGNGSKKKGKGNKYDT